MVNIPMDSLELRSRLCFSQWLQHRGRTEPALESRACGQDLRDDLGDFMGNFAPFMGSKVTGGW